MNSDLGAPEMISVPEELKTDKREKLLESFNKNVQINSEPYFYDDFDNNQKEALSTFHSLLLHFQENPDDLLDLPIIPLSDEARKSVSADELFDDDLLRNQVGEAIYNQSNYQEWFAERGFDSNFLFTPVNVPDLLYMEGFNWELSGEIDRYSRDRDFEPQQITLKKALEVIRVQTVGEIYLEETKQRALDTLAKFAPELISKKEIETIFDPNFSFNGAYFGEYKDKHYLAARTSLSLNPYLSSNSTDQYSLELDESVVVHEMIHLKQGEIYGCKDFFQLNQSFDEIITDSEGLGKREIANMMQDVVYDKKYHDESKEIKLSHTLCEGEAVMGQLLLCREKMAQTSDSKAQEALKMVYDRNLVNRLRLRDESSKKFSECDLEKLGVYRKGFDIIRPLQKEFGMDNLFSILSNVDNKRLSGIKMESEEAKKILADPRLLPGLENNPYIVESLKNRPAD